MPSEFDVDPYDPYDPEERPSIGWSLRKRIIFGLIAILAILSMLGSAIAGVLWLAADDQRPPPTRPTPTPTPWWGPVVTAPDQAIITRSDHPAELLLHTAEAAYATDTGILSIKRVLPTRTASESNISPVISSNSNNVSGSATLTYSRSAIGSVAMISRIRLRSG